MKLGFFLAAVLHTMLTSVSDFPVDRAREHTVDGWKCRGYTDGLPALSRGGGEGGGLCEKEIVGMCALLTQICLC